MLTGSAGGAGWRGDFVWKREDYIVKLSGHPDADALWLDPAGNPSDMLVSWRGLTTNMLECIWYGTDKEWRVFVN